MPIRLDCPRCKNPLAVPSKKAGSYATCPRCQGRFWVPDDTKETFKEPEEPPVLAAGTAGPPASRAAPPVPPGVPGSASPPDLPGAAPVVAAPGRKIARFIAADPAPSSLKVAPDGKLPELKLGEAADSLAEKPSGSRGMHPLVLFGLLAVSVVTSIVLVLAPTDSAVPSKTLEREQARRIIETEYFRELDEDVPPRPYQLLLREAKVARARGDYAKERELYRRVLDLLRADPKPAKGITGSAERDSHLERQLIILLSD
jgi:hypothetical protein